MKRGNHPLRLNQRATPILLWALSLILVAVCALLLPTSQRLLAGDLALTGPIDGVEPSAAPQQEAAPAVSRPTSRTTYVVEDPNAYVYTVRLGEYWIGIARQFGIEYADLRAANPELWNLRKEVIRPGDQMVIPNLDATQMVDPIDYVVVYGDSWYKIADAFGISYWDLRLDNLRLWQRRGIYIRPGDQMIIKDAQVLPETRAAVQEETTEEAVDVAEEVTPAEEAQPPAETADTPTLTPAQPGTSIGTPLPSSSAGAPILVPETPEGTTLYTVRPGDSWFRIAAAYGISFQDLRAANQALWSTRGQSIRVGDQLVIPPHGSPPPPPEIRQVPLEPEDEDAVDEEVEEEAVGEEVELIPALPTDAATPVPLATVELDEERVGPMQAETPEAGRLRIELAEPTIIYVVQAGDDWASIAARTGVTVEALQAANPALSARALQAGDQLRLP
ncbi:MAG: LysM peptidoglycan-binding domain-containing protein [Caldilineaceae bacterium]|nr:LysM peptidoglycan-binding domain-containing protein [Caldilineaceae bacterium]